MVIKTGSKYLTETNAGFCFVYGFLLSRCKERRKFS
jgi:hypothetical protein